MERENNLKNNFKKAKTRPGAVLILAGLVLMLFTSYWRLNLNKEKRVQTALASQQKSSSLQAKQIKIPSLGVSAFIETGGVINDQWILSDDKVLFSPEGANPGEGSNTILYAHNKPSLFANLKWLSWGAPIYLKNTRGKDFIYQVYSLEWASPYEVDKIQSDIENNLTLFTCDGWFDEARLIVKAKQTYPLPKN